MNHLHFLNGNIVSEEDLRISPRDLGYSRGYGVFEFFRTYRHKPFMLNRHIDRLFRSASSLDLEIPWKKEQITEWVLQTLDVNRSEEEKVVRVLISGGSSRSLIPSGEPTIVIMLDSVITFPSDLYERGIGAITSRFQRYIPEAKTTNYIEAVRHMRHVESAGADELIYYDDEAVREGACSNLFAVIDNRLITAKTRILEGITRGVLLEILPPEIEVEIGNFLLTDLERASEVFITASGKEIVPVKSIDGRPVRDGSPGPVTKAVITKYRNFIDSDSW